MKIVVGFNFKWFNYCKAIIVRGLIIFRPSYGVVHILCSNKKNDANLTNYILRIKNLNKKCKDSETFSPLFRYVICERPKSLIYQIPLKCALNSFINLNHYFYYPIVYFYTSISCFCTLTFKRKRNKNDKVLLSSQNVTFSSSANLIKCSALILRWEFSSVQKYYDVKWPCFCAFRSLSLDFFKGNAIFHGHQARSVEKNEILVQKNYAEILI